MSYIIFRTLYMFFVVVEFILLISILLSWFPLSSKLREMLNTIIDPILNPIRYLLHHSIFQSNVADLSPIIGFIIISFLQSFFYLLSV